jgi:hypothetical protein
MYPGRKTVTRFVLHAPDGLLDIVLDLHQGVGHAARFKSAAWVLLAIIY